VQCREQSASYRCARAALALLLCASTLIGPLAAPAHAEPVSIPNPCQLPVVGNVCDAVGGAVSSVASATGEYVMRGVTEWVTDAAVWVTGKVGDVVNGTTSPDLTASWFQGEYGAMLAVAGALALLMLMLAVIQALMRQDVWMLVRAAFGYLPMAFILAGVAIAAFFNSIQSYVQQTQTSSIRQVYSWILGRLVTAGWDDVILVLPYVVLSVAVIFLHRRLLDSLTLGEDEITSLGIPVRRVRLIVVVAATLGTAAVVAVGGTIAFVGIIVPHTIRLLVGRSYRVVIPLSVLFGAAFLVLADTAARTVVAPAELPIGVITAFLGAPFFIAVMRSTRGAPL